MDDDESDGEYGWVITRSYVHPATWVPVPYGLDYDQTYALHCGPLRTVQRWVLDAYHLADRPHRWKRLDADHYLLVDSTTGEPLA